MHKHLLIWFALLISFVMLAFLPTWNEVQRRSTVGSDFATYYYAVKVAQSDLRSLDISSSTTLSKNAFLHQLKTRQYIQQSVVFLTRDATSFQTVARIKKEMAKSGISVRLAAKKNNPKSARKKYNALGFAYTVSTSPSGLDSFELYLNGNHIKTISSKQISADLIDLFSNRSGTYSSKQNSVSVRPYGVLSDVFIHFENNQLSLIRDKAGAPLSTASFPPALEKPKSPYDARALSMSARQDLVWKDRNNNNQLDPGEMRSPRKSVHPFLYPPPALALTSWVGLFPLPTAFVAFHFLLWVSFFLSLYCFRRWLNTPLYALAAFAIAYTPVTNSIVMGQINLIVLLAIVISVFWRSGVALSVAGMIKMSPALLVAPFTLFGVYRYPVMAFLGALLLSFASLPWVGFQDQIEFYRVLLPQFSSGEYLGLKIPIDMPSNHSLPNLFHQIWPGDSSNVLSPKAKTASSILLLILFSLLSVSTYFMRHKKREALHLLCGAYVVLMILTPVYAYEHHLVFAALPIFVLFKHLREGPSPFFAKIIFLGSCSVLACPLSWLRELRHQSTYLEWVYQESKCIALLVLMLCCMWAAKRSQSALKAL